MTDNLSPDSSSQQHQYPYPDPLPPERAHPHRARRVLATVASTALVAGVVGAGAGFAAGHQFAGSSSGTSAGGTPRSTTFGSQNGESGNGGGTQPVPGNPGWTWSTQGDGQGQSSQGEVPSDPFGNSNPFGDTNPFGSQGGGGTPGESTTKASGSQLTGLVRITSTMKYAGAKAAGTGMVLTSNGEVVTNHHVVEGATTVRAKVMSTGRTYVATVVGTDAEDDVAVLQLVGASGLSTVTTDTDGASVGDKVTAVGDANGTVNTFSAAGGKVLALNQSITTQSEGTAASERLTGLMRISSDVISGDSGGATYDSDGEVVGMTTAASSGGSNVTGYAVPIAQVRSVVDDLENGVASSRYDYTRPAFLGVGLTRTGTGTTVAGVYRGTPAAEAGLTTGDRITKVGSTAVSTAKRLHAAIAAYSPGASVSLTWTTTGGATKTATVTLIAGAVE